MNKTFLKVLLGVALVFLFAGKSFAAPSPVSVRLEQPASKIGQSMIDLTFVALDIQGRPVAVQCYKQGPGDASWVAFGSVINLSPNGGNTDKCHVGSDQINQSGHTYQFEVVATAGSDLATSKVVSLDFNNDVPDAPVSYSKSKSDSCTYRISFHTASDNGKTVAVYLYRSKDSSFTLDNGSKVDSMSIGSNMDGHFDNNLTPNCDTNYYYAIRAFSAYGVPSNAVGDNPGGQTVVVSPTSTPAQGAIPVTETLTAAKKEVLGKATESAQPTPSLTKPNVVSASANWVLTHKKISLLVVLIILLGIGYYLYRQQKKK